MVWSEYKAVFVLYFTLFGNGSFIVYNYSGSNVSKAEPGEIAGQRREQRAFTRRLRPHLHFVFLSLPHQSPFYALTSTAPSEAFLTLPYQSPTYALFLSNSVRKLFQCSESR